MVVRDPRRSDDEIVAELWGKVSVGCRHRDEHGNLAVVGNRFGLQSIRFGRPRMGTSAPTEACPSPTPTRCGQQS